MALSVILSLKNVFKLMGTVMDWPPQNPDHNITKAVDRQ